MKNHLFWNGIFIESYEISVIFSSTSADVLLFNHKKLTFSLQEYSELTEPENDKNYFWKLKKNSWKSLVSKNFKKSLVS